MTFRIIFRNSFALDFAQVLYIDRAFVLVNKPPKFVTQYPRDGQTEAVAELVGQVPSTPNSTKLFPVHRLDKGTTGCLVFARSPDYAQTFSRQLKQRTVNKIYHALVNTSSSPILSARTDSGEIRVGMSLKDGRPYISQSSSARETWTDWQVLGSSSQTDIALLKLHLHTGMKHQLRVHMSDVMQAPIVGDLQHTSAQASSCTLPPILNDRLFLHASEISFHRFKRTGKQKRLNLTIRAPLPLDFAELCYRTGIEVPSYLKEGGLFVNGQPMTNVPDLDGFWVYGI
ncbi:pseudouridine synthase [Lentinula detonsa]|uniref:21S rRNA pseudouridine(2819) synthase n=1 Tax=Lentinula detonsa TaxID=2804962 RepID=A0AA38UNQ0_9AGAR|nr:pseudouridine synthase [Lentinula detonsa]